MSMEEIVPYLAKHQENFTKNDLKEVINEGHEKLFSSKEINYNNCKIVLQKTEENWKIAKHTHGGLWENIDKSFDEVLFIINWSYDPNKVRNDNSLTMIRIPSWEEHGGASHGLRLSIKPKWYSFKSKNKDFGLCYSKNGSNMRIGTQEQFELFLKKTWLKAIESYIIDYDLLGEEIRCWEYSIDRIPKVYPWMMRMIIWNTTL